MTDGLQPILTEFAPDGLPAVLFGLTLVPVNGSAATVAVTDLSRTIADAAIRDTEAGTVYPAPLATISQLSAIDAAYPDYAEFFGTDGAYSSYGLAVSGQWQTP